MDICSGLKEKVIHYEEMVLADIAHPDAERERGERRVNGPVGCGTGQRGVRSISCLCRRRRRSGRRDGDGGIRAKLMVIFYGGSARSVLPNSVITSLVRGARPRGRGRKTVVFVTSVNESPGLIEW